MTLKTTFRHDLAKKPLGCARVVLTRLCHTNFGCKSHFTNLLIKSDLERETRFELATPTLARSCSTN